jgi:hypothetical protein
MSKDKNRPRLGRGLSSLLSMPDPDADYGALSESAAPISTDPGSASAPPSSERAPLRPSLGVMELPIDSIQPASAPPGI